MWHFRVPCPSQPTVPLNLQGPGLNLGCVNVEVVVQRKTGRNVGGCAGQPSAEGCGCLQPPRQRLCHPGLVLSDSASLLPLSPYL